MKKIFALITIAGAAAGLTQCTPKTAPTARPTVKEEVANAKSKYTPEQMANGKVVFDNNCGKCHDLPQVNAYTVSAWDDILPGMSRKANLTANDAAILHAWVVTNAKPEAADIPGVPH